MGEDDRFFAAITAKTTLMESPPPIRENGPVVSMLMKLLGFGIPAISAGVNPVASLSYLVLSVVGEKYTGSRVFWNCHD